MKNIFTFLTITVCFLCGNILNAQLEIVVGPCTPTSTPRYEFLLNGAELVGNDCSVTIAAADVLTADNIIKIVNADPDNFSTLNGVSTLDVVLIFRGLVFGFDDNFEVIAADFDGDTAISTKDLIDIRRNILGIEYPVGNQQFKIVDIDYDFPVDFGPFDLTSDFTEYTFSESDYNAGNLEVRIIKSGDINNSAAFNSEDVPTSRESAFLSYNDIVVEAGESYEVEFSFNTESDFRAATFELLGEGVNIIELDENNNDIISNNKTTALGVSYFSEHPETTFSFSIELEATASGNLSDMININEDFLHEHVDIDGAMGVVSLSANVVSDVDDFTAQLFEISPNPVSDVLNINFKSDALDAQKIVELISIDGKIISKYLSTAQSLSIDMTTINSTGIHMLRVTQDGKTTVQKVLVQ